MKEEILDGAKDYIDERNYSYKELVGGYIEHKDFVLLEDGEIQNQHIEGYPMGCVYFASSMNDNYLNFRDKLSDRSKGGDLCDKSDTRDSKAGDYVINGAKLLKKLDLIKGYFNLFDVHDVFDALNRKIPIHTGTNRVSWLDTNSSLDKIATIVDRGPGHAFHIIGYNKTGDIVEKDNHTIPSDCFICKNSSDSYDNGYFYLKFEDLKYLFKSKFIFTNNVKNLSDYFFKIMSNLSLDSAKKAYELGIWNGENPDKPITREEASAMIYRVFEKLKK